LDSNEVISQEKAIAKASAHLVFNPRFRFPSYSKESYISGKLFVSESSIWFKGESRLLLNAFLFFIFTLPQFIFLMWYFFQKPYNSTLFTIFQVAFWSIFLIPFLISFKWHRRIKRGLLWDLGKIQIDIIENKLILKENTNISILHLSIGAEDVIDVLNRQPVEFEISSLSGLEYHEKMIILDERHNSGKISNELYEELKRKIPYT
jgi:hypothetical protein